MQPDGAGTVADATWVWQSRIGLVEEVARVLRQRIYSGAYPPGELLRQVQLSQELNVSRTPLREALRMLQSEGLVKAEGARGVSVSGADESRLLNAYAMREILDGLAARQAAERAAGRADSVLAPLLAAQMQALDPWSAGDYMRLNVEFHAAIIELADNEFLSAQLAIVRMTTTMFAPATLICAERARPSIEGHRRIAFAIAEGAADAAESEARQHIRQTLRSVLAGATSLAARAP
ncbi:GntR family transcriptional regulator [soil metagenome]